MKTEYTDAGWRDITTDTTIITNTSDDPFMSEKDWVETNKKLKMKKYRFSCRRCKREFKDTRTGSVYLIFTNNGNKIICEDCQGSIKNTGNPVEALDERKASKTNEAI